MRYPTGVCLVHHEGVVHVLVTHQPNCKCTVAEHYKNGLEVSASCILQRVARCCNHVALVVLLCNVAKQHWSAMLLSNMIYVSTYIYLYVSIVGPLQHDTAQNFTVLANLDV